MWSSSNFSVRIIPADAGSTRWNAENPSSGADHPRGYGEHADVLSPISFDPGSSPRIRGALVLMCICGKRTRIIPADTGSTLRWWAYTPNEQDHPRRCGEHSPKTTGK